MKMRVFCLFGMLCLLLGILNVRAEEKSDRLKPRWIKSVPSSGSPDYYFKVVYTDAASDLAGARLLARKELALSIERSEHISIEENLEYNSSMTGFAGKETVGENYSFRVKSGGDPQYLHYERIDEYWEKEMTGGRYTVRLYTLFAVGSRTGDVTIGRYRRETQYGARGAVRSLIPGWGQMYKGSMAKGGIILGGEIAFAGAIIAAENLRASYVRKMKENPRHVKSYSTKADNWENVRNICIGGAAALYVYNLVDAIVAPGAPRLVKARQRGLAFTPAVTPDYNGISLVFKF